MRRGGLIKVNVAEKMRSLGADICCLKNRVGHDLVLYRKVVVDITRNFKLGSGNPGRSGTGPRGCAGWLSGKRMIEQIQLSFAVLLIVVV